MKGYRYDEELYKKEFSSNLQRVLNDKNVSQRKLSEDTGISEVSISRYLNGKRIPSFYTIEKIALALKCSTDEFRCF